MGEDRLQPYEQASPPMAGGEIAPAAILASRPGGSFSAIDYIEPMFAHRRLIVGALLLAMLLGWLAILFWPRKFSSEAKLLLKVGRESVALDPTATTSETLMLQKTQEEEVNSALELLASRQLAERVVEQLGSGPILSGHLPGEGGEESSLRELISNAKNFASDSLYQTLLYAGIKDEISDRELAVMKLQKSVDIWATKKSTVITIDAKSKSPEMAQAITSAVTEAFLAEHVRSSATEGSGSFFVKQARETEDKLNGLLDRRSALMQEKQIASVDSKRVALTSRLSEIETDMLSTQAALKRVASEIDDLEEKLAATPDEIVAAKLEQRDTTWSGMRSRLYELELQERSLAANLTPGHPELEQVRKQLSDARSILAEMQSDRVDQNRAPNPAKQRIEQSLQEQETAAVGYEALLDARQAQFAQTHYEISELLDYELELEELERQIAVTENNLSMLRHKEEEARVIEELQSRKITNVSVLQPANFIERPVSPRKKLMAAAFVMMGLCAGVGLIYLRELSTSKIRTAQHVRAGLGQHVVAEIPYGSTLSYVKRLVNRGDARDLYPIFKSVITEAITPSAKSDPRGGRSIGIIGITEGCGASTVATGVALTSAKQAGLTTMLVDADTQQRTISQAFRANGAPGVGELLTGEAQYPECVQTRSDSGLRLLPVSSAPPHEKPRAGNEVGFVRDIRADNDLIVLDLPPADRPDLLYGLAAELDHVFIVVESEQTELEPARRLIRRLQSQGAHVSGVVLNKTRRHMPRWFNKLLT